MLCCHCDVEGCRGGESGWDWNRELKTPETKKKKRKKNGNAQKKAQELPLVADFYQLLADYEFGNNTICSLRKSDAQSRKMPPLLNTFTAAKSNISSRLRLVLTQQSCRTPARQTSVLFIICLGGLNQVLHCSHTVLKNVNIWQWRNWGETWAKCTKGHLPVGCQTKRQMEVECHHVVVKWNHKERWKKLCFACVDTHLCLIVFYCTIIIVPHKAKWPLQL